MNQINPPSLTLALLLALLLATISGKAADPSREYKAKAVFLFNFAQFVEWPPQRFANNRAPLVIGIYGTDPFGSFLDKTVRGEIVRGRPIAIRRCEKLPEVKLCHILFISRAESGHLAQLLEEARGKAILTVSDSPATLQDGVMIRFVTDKDKVRFHINNEAAKKAGLIVSSKLLRAAQAPVVEKK